MSSEAAQKAGGGAMSTRDELAATLTAQHFDGRGCGGSHSGACSSCFGPSPMSAHEIADALIAEGWRKKPDDEALWDLADELLDGLNVYDENPPSLSEYIADRVRALMDRGQ